MVCGRGGPGDARTNKFEKRLTQFPNHSLCRSELTGRLRSEMVGAREFLQTCSRELARARRRIQWSAGKVDAAQNCRSVRCAIVEICHCQRFDVPRAKPIAIAGRIIFLSDLASKVSPGLCLSKHATGVHDICALVLDIRRSARCRPLVSGLEVRGRIRSRRRSPAPARAFPAAGQDGRTLAVLQTAARARLKAR